MYDEEVIHVLAVVHKDNSLGTPHESHDTGGNDSLAFPNVTRTVDYTTVITAGDAEEGSITHIYNTRPPKRHKCVLNDRERIE